SVRKLRSIYQDLAVDLVHLNTFLLIPAGIAAKKSGIKVIWHIREPLYRGLTGIRRHYVRKAIKQNSDAIIAISQQDAARLGGPIDKLEVVYNYIDFAKFDHSLSGRG